MKPVALFLLLCFGLPSMVWGQSVPQSREIVERSVAFHDPQGAWENYQAELDIILSRPGVEVDLPSTVTIDRPADLVMIYQDRDSVQLLQGLKQGEPYVEVDGMPGASEEDIRAYNLTANRIEYLHNYYLYLYGIPMKLLVDPATEIGEATRVTFHGMEVFRVPVSYGEPWAQHDWAFYFDVNTYEMKAYQFWRKSPEEDGEYILCEGLETIAGIRHPKVRYWYMNADDLHIATDTLLPATHQ